VGRLRKSVAIDEDKQIYNRGICGNTTDDLLKRFKAEADSLEPNVVVFAIGINDSKYPFGEKLNKIPLEQFKKNIETLLQQAKTYTNEIFVIGATQVDEEVVSQWKDSSRFYNTEIQKYNEVLKEVTASKSAVYVDVFGLLNTKTDLHDGLHPNAQGYEKLALALRKSMKI
jgi:lysophospholipase L1-like esterase